MGVRVTLGATVAVAALLLVPAAPAAITPLRWCGNDVAQSDRVHDRMGGEQIHVIYAVPADGPERFAELASLLATDVAAIDAWWRREDPTHAPRFDLFEFPGCECRFGKLDLSFVRASGRGLGLRPEHRPLPAHLDAALVEPHTSSRRPTRSTSCSSTEPSATTRSAGRGRAAGRRAGRARTAIVYLRSSCDLTIGDGGGVAYVGAHELLHTLGALPPGAPHPCFGDDGHPCDSSADVLSTFYRGGLLEAAFLDVNRDDYYAHTGPWFDIQDSRWLLEATAQVELNLSVSGSGFVTSGANGQECDGSCTTEWDARDDDRAGRRRAARLRVRVVDGRLRRDHDLDLPGRPRCDDGGRRRLSAASPALRSRSRGEAPSPARTCTACARARRRESRGPGSLFARRRPRAGASSAGAAAAAALASPARWHWARAARRRRPSSLGGASCGRGAR